MKTKTLVLIGVAFSVLLSTLVVVAAGRGKTEDWCYYDEFMEDHQEGRRVHFVDSGKEIRTLPAPDKRLSRIFDSAKERVREEFKSFPNLDWERFEDARLMEAVKYLDGTNDASYGVESNTIYVYRFLETKRDEYVEPVLAHELIHALTVVEDESQSILYEGLTEYMSMLLYDTENVAYEFSVRFVQLYAEKFGLERAIEVFPYDNCAEVMSELFSDRNNVMCNIEDVILLVCIAQNKEGECIALDVMAHLCKELDGNKNIVMDLAKRRLGNEREALNYLGDVLR